VSIWVSFRGLLIEVEGHYVSAPPISARGEPRAVVDPGYEDFEDIEILGIDTDHSGDDEFHEACLEAAREEDRNA